VQKAGGGLLGNVFPGFWLHTTDGISDLQTEVLGVRTDTELIVDKNHTIVSNNAALRTGKILELSGAVITAPSKKWLCTYPYSPHITVQEGYHYMIALSGSESGDMFLGGELVIRSKRMS